MKTYILDGKFPIVEPNILKWGTWFENIDNRRVAYDNLDDGQEISTVFLGIEGNFSVSGLSLLFETLIQGGDYDGYMIRYATWEQAKKGHRLIVRARLDGDAADLE